MVRFADPLATAIAHLTITVGFVRVPTASRWQDSAWQLDWVRPAEAAGSPEPAASAASGTHAASAPASDGALEHAWNRTTLAVHRDEAEGYWLNLTATEPSIFVLWRAEDGQAPDALAATLSYNEAGRWMDAGETVDRVPMPAEMVAWLADWVNRAYEPQPRKRQRGEKPSFMDRDRFARFARGDGDAAAPTAPAPADGVPRGPGRR